MTDFHLGTAQHSCSSCQQEIFPDHLFFSTVLLYQDQIQRQEFCENCWLPERNIGMYWRSKSKRIKEKAPPPDLNLLWELFWESRQNSPYVHYFLALVLLRKRVLEFVKSQQEKGQRFLIVKSKKNKKWLKIPDLSQHVQELEKIQQELETTLPDLLSNSSS